MASLIVGVVCAVLGCYVVLRSMAFLGDALAHAIFPGVVGGLCLLLALYGLGTLPVNWAGLLLMGFGAGLTWGACLMEWTQGSAGRSKKNDGRSHT